MRLWPRRHGTSSTCSSRGSATRVASTRATGTTSASWSSTSSRAGMTAPGRRSSTASSPRSASTATRSALLKPQTYMNDSGRSVQRGNAVLQARAGRRPRSERRERSAERGGCRPGSAAGSPATTAFARSPSTSGRPSSCGSGSAWGGPSAAIRARSRTTSCRISSPMRTPTRSSHGLRMRSRRSMPRVSKRPSAASTSAAKYQTAPEGPVAPRARESRTSRRFPSPDPVFGTPHGLALWSQAGSL